MTEPYPENAAGVQDDDTPPDVDLPDDAFTSDAPPPNDDVAP